MPAIIVDPELLARVTRQFQLRGQLQPFNLTENVIPIFDIGKLLDIDVTKVATPDSDTAVRVGTASDTAALMTAQSAIEADEINDIGFVTNPTAGTVLADSGAQAAGLVRIEGQIHLIGTNEDFRVEWRNAANNATLASFSVLMSEPAHFRFGPFTFNMALNERVRIISVNTITAQVAGFLTFSPVVRSAA